MTIYLYWTYSRIEDRLSPSALIKHQTTRARVSDEKTHIGGLGYPESVFTHYINRDGILHILQSFNGEIKLALEGGLNGEYKYASNPSFDQLKTLANVIRLVDSIDSTIVLNGDFTGFDLNTWIKGIKK